MPVSKQNVQFRNCESFPFPINISTLFPGGYLSGARKLVLVSIGISVLGDSKSYAMKSVVVTFLLPPTPRSVSMRFQDFSSRIP